LPTYLLAVGECKLYYELFVAHLLAVCEGELEAGTPVTEVAADDEQA
jgi:hypothetical protein